MNRPEAYGQHRDFVGEVVFDSKITPPAKSLEDLAGKLADDFVVVGFELSMHDGRIDVVLYLLRHDPSGQSVLKLTEESDPDASVQVFKYELEWDKTLEELVGPIFRHMHLVAWNEVLIGNRDVEVLAD